MELFRRQVIERRSTRLLGEVSLSSPVSTWVVTGLVALVVAAALAMLVAGSHARKEVVSGWLKPDRGLARVVAPRSGTVSAVHVAEGQAVAAGEALLALDLDTGLAGGERVFGTVLAEIRAQIAERERLLPLAAQRFAREEEELRARIGSVQAELASLEAQRQVLRERERNAVLLRDRLGTLADGNAVSRLEVERQQEAVLSLRQSAQQVAGRIAAMKGDLAAYRSQLGGAPARRQEALAEMRAALAALKAQLAQVAGQGEAVLEAPVAGRVAALAVSRGQNVRAQQLAVALLPEGGRLEAELFVPTRAAGFIRPGQPVRLQLDAFPHQRFGVVAGEVASVSRTVFEPAELPVSLPVAGPVYRVLASLSSQEVDAYGERFPLQAGMTLSAHVVQEERRLWQVLLDPLLARL